MQLSCKRGIGFICVPKCGSTTIESYFRPYSDFSLSGNPRLKHVKYSEYEKHLLPLLGVLGVKPPFMFAVLRDPADWVRSWYQFRKRDELADPEHPQHHNYSGKVSLDEFAELTMTPRPPSFARILSQSSYITNLKGDLGVDRLVPLERIASDVPVLLGAYGIKLKEAERRKNVSEVRVSQSISINARDKMKSHYASDYSYYHQSQIKISA